MRRSKADRTRIIFWIISLLVVISMGLSLAVAFAPPRPPTPTPMPTFTPSSARILTPTSA
ncbi:MAG TPA: hypothetical protein G4N97_11600 [Thermoflexia bacterium]|nr:hypothetical protein [Thermoflexia bacterium]